MNLLALNFVNDGALPLYYLKIPIQNSLTCKSLNYFPMDPPVKVVHSPTFDSFNKKDEEQRRYAFWLFKNE